MAKPKDNLLLLLLSMCIAFLISIFVFEPLPSNQEANAKRVQGPLVSFEDCQTYDCVKSKIPVLIKSKGPAYTLSQMDQLINERKINPYFDIHQFAHEVGRQSAKIEGVSGQAFLSCSIDFNYGCQHGFFEYALTQADSTEQAANQVCSSLPKNLPSKMQFYCYHGLGHGVMMAQAYDLNQALSVCDSLGSNGQEGCWQGVFMENTNSAMRNEARDGIFSESDPLAPCNKIENIYKWQCYINHAGYLMKFFRGDFEEATGSCLPAEEKYVSACLQSLGLMVSNQTWQRQIGENPKDEPEFYKSTCQKFPKGHIEDCVIGTVDNIMNFDQLDITRAGTFCSLVDQDYKKQCWQHVYIGIKNQSTNAKEIQNLCEQFEEKYQSVCQAQS